MTDLCFSFVGKKKTKPKPFVKSPWPRSFTRTFHQDLSPGLCAPEKGRNKEKQRKIKDKSKKNKEYKKKTDGSCVGVVLPSSGTKKKQTGQNQKQFFVCSVFFFCFFLFFSFSLSSASFFLVLNCFTILRHFFEKETIFRTPLTPDPASSRTPSPGRARPTLASSQKCKECCVKFYFCFFVLRARRVGARRVGALKGGG